MYDRDKAYRHCVNPTSWALTGTLPVGLLFAPIRNAARITLSSARRFGFGDGLVRIKNRAGLLIVGVRK